MLVSKTKPEGSSPSFSVNRRVCSLMVKRTAHNGNNIGSTPIKLNVVFWIPRRGLN